MNNTIKGVFIFITGAAVGSAVTWKLLNMKLAEQYEQRYREDVQSTKEAYSRLSKDKESSEEYTDNIVPADKLPDVKEYAAMLKEENYFDYSNGGSSEDPDKEVTVDEPYMISPEEFGEFEDYEKISLTYYSDGKLADENDDLVDDVDEIVGEESLTHFGEYEDDSVFVRNDSRKCDYEILLDQRNYFDVVKTKPHHSVED